MRNVFVAAFLALAAISACDRRDPQAEFESLRIAVFPTPKAGLDVAQEYIDHFHSRKGNRVTEVSEIRDQYRSMEGFFSKTFRSYPEFMREAETLDRSLSSCNYEGVRNTWKNLYSRERERLLAPLMNGITEDTFDSFFRTQVRSLCENQFLTWSLESIDQVDLKTLTVVRDGTAKESSGVYRVHLRGSILGFRTSTATVSISGLIGVNPAGDIVSERTGYDFMDQPIL
jgi:hypothetical protein